MIRRFSKPFCLPALLWQSYGVNELLEMDIKCEERADREKGEEEKIGIGGRRGERESRIIHTPSNATNVESNLSLLRESIALWYLK